MFRKTVITLLMTIMFCTSFAWASDANYYISAGRSLMFDGTLSGLRLAYETFDNGLNDPSCADCSTNRELIFLHALARITMWGAKDDGEPIDSAIELAREFGVDVLGDYFYELDVNCPNDVDLPKNQHDAYIIPEETQDIINEIRDFLGTSARPEINDVLEELNSIWDAPGDRFRVFFTPDETQVFFGLDSPGLQNDVEVDYAEVMILKAMLKGFKGLLQTQMAYDLYIDANDMLIEKNYGNSFSINADLLEPHPDFLNVLPTANDSNDGAAILAQAAQDWIDSINYYLDMVDYVRSEEDSQDDDLLCIDPNDNVLVNKISDRLTALRDSLINDTAATVPLETTKTYTLVENSSPSTWELKLVFDFIGLDAEGSFALVSGSGLPSPWEITAFTIEGNVLTAEMDYDVPGYWGGAWLEADISQDCNTITNGIFEYWGPSYGTISNLSGQIINIDIEEEGLDLNPIFGGSQRYPNPVNPRDLLPVVDQWNAPLSDTVGHGLGDDPTLGGILPGMSQYDWQVSFNLQPSGLFYLDFISPWLIQIDGNTSDWSITQLVFTDPNHDTEEDSNDVNGVDIENFYMAYDWENVYGAINFYDDIDSSSHYYTVFLSYSPDDTSALHSIKVDISVSGGSASGNLYYMDADSYGWTYWQYVNSINVAVGQNAIEFKIPFSDIPAYLPGRFVTVTSNGWDQSWSENNGEDNPTHLQIGEIGSISGTISYDGYKGDPIFVHAYTDAQDPDGSIVASTMITEPGAYTIDGIGLGWRGYIRAFTPLFGFDNPFELEAFDIQAAMPVYLLDTNLNGVNLTLNYPTILEKDTWESGEIDADTQEVNWFAFDAVQGGTYTLDLTNEPSGYACITLYGRDGKTQLAETYSWQTPKQIIWLCPASGRYYVKAADDGSMYPGGGPYHLRMTTDVTCPDTDIASAEGIGVMDCKVDFYDLSALVSRWLNSCSSPYWCDNCDFDESGSVDFTDFAALANEWMGDGNP